MQATIMKNLFKILFLLAILSVHCNLGDGACVSRHHGNRYSQSVNQGAGMNSGSNGALDTGTCSAQN
uniref:Uncharacterized protein n=1 Tax=Trichobilharzia regenti TaxID=157069 RepID=A0AA85KEQ8_TRIRE|nr:unnamed protein product [Trichobilharzia regenti]